MAKKSKFRQFMQAFAISLVAAISTFATHLARKDVISVIKHIN